jgi:hypothetical protein
MVRAAAAGCVIALAHATGVVAMEPRGDVSLRVDGKEIALPHGVAQRLARLAREATSRCGPNPRHHPHKFGPEAKLASERRARTLQGSRLHVAYRAPFESTSHLGGTLMVSEVTLGIGGDGGLFVGPDFTRHAGQVVEHLQCEYLPSLEIACLPELAPHLPRRYRETCARLARGADGTIVMPPPDIAPSCS